MSDSDRPVPPPVTAPGAGPANQAPARSWFQRRRRELGEPIESADEAVPRGMRIAGAWSWRLLVVGAVIAVIVFLIIQLKLIVIPVLIAVLLAGLLVPFKDFLIRHRWPKWLAILTVLITLVIIVGGLFYLAIWQVTRQSG